MTRLCFYLSDHGYGHMARTIPVLQHLLTLPEIELYVVCGERQIQFAQQNLSIENISRIHFRSERTDIGLILQEGTLEPDPIQLEFACRDYLAELPARSEYEAGWLRAHFIDAVYCDMPIWSISAAQKAQIPLLYVGNFTWTELYREFLPQEIWHAYAAEYRKIQHALYFALYNHEMLEFVPNGVETSLTARSFDPNKVQEIAAAHRHPLVFAALGMSAAFTEPIDVSEIPCDFVTTPFIPLQGKNVTVLPADTADTQNYMKAADYIITKAGWGSVAEGLLAQKPMALFRRDHVLEDRNTIQQLENLGLAVGIEKQDLHNMAQIVRKMDNLSNRDYSRFYRAEKEIADTLLSLAKEERKNR